MHAWVGDWLVCGWRVLLRTGDASICMVDPARCARCGDDGDGALESEKDARAHDRDPGRCTHTYAAAGACLGSTGPGNLPSENSRLLVWLPSVIKYYYAQFCFFTLGANNISRRTVPAVSRAASGTVSALSTPPSDGDTRLAARRLGLRLGAAMHRRFMGGVSPMVLFQLALRLLESLWREIVEEPKEGLVAGTTGSCSALTAAQAAAHATAVKSWAQLPGAQPRTSAAMPVLIS